MIKFKELKIPPHHVCGGILFQVILDTHSTVIKYTLPSGVEKAIFPDCDEGRG